MYYELGTMVRIRKDASPFVNHEKGIGYPRFDVIGEIVCIYPTILSYAVRLSKKFTLTFYQDDIYELPDCISSRRDIFHKMISFDKANQPLYYPTEFESFVNEDKYCEHDIDALEATFKRLQLNSSYGMHPEYFPGYRFTPVDSSLKALGELNRREFERIVASPIKIDIDDEIKAHYSIEEIKKMINNTFGVPKFEYKKIIFNGPCTIILWKDDTKTIAKASGGDVFDPEKGVAICFMKKILGHTETNKVLRKASEQYEDYIAENGIHVTLLDNIAAFLGDVDEINKKLEEEQDD